MDFFHYLQNDLNIHLNEQQTEAIKACDQRILLEACPGSGKTTTLVARIAYQILCRNANPSGILTLTFSRASARDMERRFNRFFGNLISQPVHFSTIHSFCYQFLFFCQKNGMLVVPGLIESKVNNGKAKALRNIYIEANQEYPGDDQIDILSNEVSFVKNKLVQPSQFKSEYQNFSIIYQKYEAYKKEKYLIDFDDMLSMTYDILCGNRVIYQKYGRFPFVLVDEVQDTSLLQHRIIEELSRDENLFMVGDTDQSIYGFRGAEPEYIVNIKKLYPDTKILRLENNYRSTGRIVHMANAFIGQNQLRHLKNMVTGNEQGAIPDVCFLKDMEEQNQMVLKLIGEDCVSGKVAVLFRNNLSGLTVAWQLIQKGLPFHVRDNYSSFFRHFVIADIFAFFQFASDFSDIDSFVKIYYKMGAALSKNDVLKLKESPEKEDILSQLYNANYHRKHILNHLVRIRKGFKRIKRQDPYHALETVEQELLYGDYLKRNTGCLHIFSTAKYLAMGTTSLEEFKTRLRTLKNGIDQHLQRASGEAVQLLTLHGSKGLEFDRVIMIDLIDGEFPGDKSLEDLNNGNRKAYEEEVRLFYVGVTRARKEVYLLSRLYSERKKVTPSRFIHQFLDSLQVEEIVQGQIVHHRKFGEGVVQGYKDGVAEILFRKCGYRRLSVKTCLEAGLMKLG